MSRAEEVIKLVESISMSESKYADPKFSKDVVKKIKDKYKVKITSYEWQQWAEGERGSDGEKVDTLVSEVLGDKYYELEDQGRTNKQVAAFLKKLDEEVMNLKDEEEKKKNKKLKYLAEVIYDSGEQKFTDKEFISSNNSLLSDWGYETLTKKQEDAFLKLLKSSKSIAMADRNDRGVKFVKTIMLELLALFK